MYLKFNDKILEFEGSKLVKVNGQRPEYMGGDQLIRLVKQLAEWTLSTETLQQCDAQGELLES